MHSASFFEPAEQDKICKYLEKISKKDITEQEAKDIINDLKSVNGFIISDEIKTPHSLSEKNRYFHLFFQDVRMDELSYQFTPMVVFRKGILKIDDQGKLSILNTSFNSMDVNSKFSFENNTLKLNLDDTLMYQKSNSCNIL